jgi:hypothetical protein
MSFKVPNHYRIRKGPLASDDSIGFCGAFSIILNKKISIKKKYILICIADDGCNGMPINKCFEHVSCYKHDNKKRYTPSWNDMCYVKSLFWDDEDCVIQYHPSKSQYVNINPFVLHLWRPIGIEIPIPPKELV